MLHRGRAFAILAAGVLAAAVAPVRAAPHVAGDIAPEVVKQLRGRDRDKINRAAREHGETTALFYYTVGDVLFRRVAGTRLERVLLPSGPVSDPLTQGVLREAVRFLGKAKTESAAYTEVFYSLGLAHYMLGGYEPAAANLRAYIDRWAGATVTTYHATAYKALGYVLKALGKRDDARDALRSYLRHAPSEPDAEDIMREMEILKSSTTP